MKMKLICGIATAFILLFIMGCSQPSDMNVGSLPPDVCAVIYTEKAPSMEGYQPKTYLLKQGELENFREHHRGFSRAIDYERLKFRETQNPMLNNDVILCVVRAAAGADERLKIAAFDLKSQEWTFLFTPNSIPRERHIADYKFMMEQQGNYFDLPPHAFNYSDLK